MHPSLPIRFSIVAMTALILLNVFGIGSAHAYLSEPRAGAPLDIAFGYLRQHAQELGLTPADLSEIVVKDNYVTAHNGVTHIVLRQRYHGIEVFNGDIAINIAADGSVINLHNGFIPNLAEKVNATQPALGPRQAVESAAQALNLSLSKSLEIVEQIGGPAQEFVLSDGGISLENIPAKLMYAKRGGARLAWNVRIRQTNQQNWPNLRIDALTGEVLAQNDWIVNDTLHHDAQAPAAAYTVAQAPAVAAAPDQAPFSASFISGYRVIAPPLESPQHGPGLPGSHSFVEDPDDAVASPYGWHDTNGAAGAEFNDTRGNNVYAQEDADDNNAGGIRAAETSPGTLGFDYAFNPALEPTGGTNQAAAITNLFFWNNIIHDIMVHYGFDEAAGNFQENNYSGQGLGNDPVQADAQDGSGENNANFATPVDGLSPRMQMYIWTLTTPWRDSSLDNGVIIHEYGHGISNRLTGGPANVDCLWNDEQMGEGWSDWYGLVLTAQSTDVGTNGRGIGTYVLGEPTTGPGIRDFPYSTDMGIDPRTYDSIKSATGYHPVGSVWAAMIWEVYWALVDEYGFDPDLYTGTGGNNLALQLITDGLKLQTCEPGFVDGRDAILAADQVNTGGANQCLIWEAFAKRGLGYSADQGSSYSVTDGTQAFDLPPICTGLAITKSSLEPSAAIGSQLHYTLTISSGPAGPFTGVVISDTLPAGVTYVAGSASDGGSEAGGIVTWPAVNLGTGQTIQRTLTVEIPSSYPAPSTRFWDDAESGGAAWIATGLWHLENGACANAQSPVTSWYYGDSTSCTYETGAANFGTLTSAAPIALPAGEGSILRFASWEKTEELPGFDTRIVYISTDNVIYTPIWESDDDSGAWRTVEINLSAYAGQNVWIRFEFDTDDEQFNNYTGWYIDDITVFQPAWLVNKAGVKAAEGDSHETSLTTEVLAGQPTLQIPTNIPATYNTTVSVPISFTGNANPIRQVAFSLDIDPACLAFDPTDGDSSGLPDAITLNTPAGFTGSASYDGSDSSAELDIVITDSSAPYASLPDGQLLTIEFLATCEPTSGSTVTTAVAFTPAGHTFTDVFNRVIEGSVANGSAVIGEANGAPSFTSAAVTAATVGEAYSYAIATLDPDTGDTRTIAAPTKPGWLTLTDNGNGTATLSGTPTAADVGTHNVTLRVTDTGGLSTEQSFTITVGEANGAPSFTSAAVTAATVGEAYSYAIATLDPDTGDTRTIAAPTKPGWLTLTDNGNGTATLSGTPTAADVGTHNVTLRVTDTGGLSTEQSFTITVGEEAVYLPLVQTLAE